MKNLFVFLLFLICGLSEAQNELFIGSDFALTNTGRLTIENGNFYNESGTSVGGTIEFRTTDGGTYTLSSDAGPELINTLEIIGPGQLDILSGIRLESELFLDGGSTLDLGSSNIILNSNAEIVGEDDSNIITGDSGSYITISREHSGGFNDFGLIGFTLITSNVNMGETEVFRRYGNIEIDGNPTIIRYYEIHPTNNSGLNAQAQFDFLINDINGLDPGVFSLYRSTDGATNWVERGGSVTTGPRNFMDLAGIDEFSFWAIGEEGSVLPVELVFFDAEAIDDTYVLCTWETASEENNSHFDVERSQNGQLFEYVGEVSGAGTTDVNQDYSFNDGDPYTGTSYYRLKQVDFDGTFEYSEIRQVYIDKSSGLVLFPNPAREVVHISLPERIKFQEFKIYDVQGRLVKTGDLSGVTGQIDMDISELANGQYILELLNTNEEPKNVKFIKQ